MILASSDFNIRRAGVLLHPTALPSGVLNSDVERWLQLLNDSGYSVWQVLPLGEPQIGLSPYQCSSAFAMNPMLLPELPAISENDSDFAEFCNKQQFWLDDYALFKVLKESFNGAIWSEWPDEWKFRQTQAIQQAHQQHERAITKLKWQQYQLHKRWQEIRSRAAEKGIQLFGDMPIFVAYDSADVWAHPEWFLLDSNGMMKVVTGVPPDYFSETGQRWGNPHYDWEAMHESDYSWWMSRIKHHLDQFDLLRIDHFRGLESVWMIDSLCETAVDGHWQKVPGDELLSKIKNEYEHLPFVAEDLGIITPEVVALRKKYGLPGMSILQFGFDEFEDSPHKPQNIEEDKVVYTGTHDNDTTRGWFNSLEDHTKDYVLRRLGLMDADSHDWRNIPYASDRVVETLIDNALNSRASIAIIPMQDCLHLDSEARMNTPGTTTGNWHWQFQWQQHDSHRINEMRTRIKNTQRLISKND
jgi:4-alpha-glucanotransferase